MPWSLKTAILSSNFNTLVTEGKKNGNLPTFILTSGGTGLNSDDQTVEAVRPHLDKEVPGIMHAFWMNGLKNVPAAVLSRGVAGVIDRTFVMTLPGSRGGVKDGVATLDPLVEHICRQMEDYHATSRRTKNPWTIRVRTVLSRAARPWCSPILRRRPWNRCTRRLKLRS